MKGKTNRLPAVLKIWVDLSHMHDNTRSIIITQFPSMFVFRVGINELKDEYPLVLKIRGYLSHMCDNTKSHTIHEVIQVTG